MLQLKAYQWLTTLFASKAVSISRLWVKNLQEIITSNIQNSSNIDRKSVLWYTL